jgi:hypothetical protein
MARCSSIPTAIRSPSTRRRRCRRSREPYTRWIYGKPGGAALTSYPNNTADFDRKRAVCATLASWFGVSVAQMSTVFPNIGSFPTANLGFV